MSLAKIGTPIIKLLPPEAAHTATIKALSAGLGVPGRAQVDDPALAVTLPKSGLRLSNPIGLAAGFDKNCDVPAAMAKFGFGFVECGTVTPKPQAGNPKPRLFRLTEDKAVINRMGFNNFGLDYFTRRLTRYDGAAPIGANVGANKTSEDRAGNYVTGISAVAEQCDYITINISSPNTPGLRGLQDKSALTDLLTRCSMAVSASEKEPPAFLKVAPDLDDEAIADIVSVLGKEGAWLSGLIVSNTTIARPDSLQSSHKGETGGLSGAVLMERSTEVLADFARALNGKFDLIGVGGISSGTDAYAKITKGANAVQLYSALVYEGPRLVADIKADLLARMKADGVKSVADLVGTAL